MGIFEKGSLEEFGEMFGVVGQILKKEVVEEDVVVERLKEFLKSSNNRLALWMYLKPFSQYSLLCHLLTHLLTSCHQFQDIYIARKLTNFLFILHHHPSQSKKIYAYSSIVFHKIYSSLDFWKASIFSGVQENVRGNLRESTDDIHNNVVKYVALVFSQLAMFCHQMVMIGVPVSDVRQVVLGFCRLYEMPEREVKDLVRVINNSVGANGEGRMVEDKEKQKEKFKEK